MVSQIERDLYCLSCSGFAVLPHFLDSARVDAIARAAREFEGEVQRFVDAGGTAILRHSWPLRTTRCLYAVSREVQDLVMDPRVQALAHGYLGAPILRDCLIQTNMPDPQNAKRGPQGDVSFHRDTLWPEGRIRPMYLHVFLLLTDFGQENGATIVVPGTHRRAEPGYYFKHTDPRSAQDGIEYKVYERRYFPSHIQLEAPRGSIVLLDPMTIHTQGINVTNEPRSLINMTFRAEGVVGMPALLNARKIAEHFARVPVRSDLLNILESCAELPAHFGPIGNGEPPNLEVSTTRNS